MTHHKRSGFTLLEMMVVMSCLVVLAAVLTQSIPFLQQKARDKRRIHDLANLQRVIELYRSDNGAYPTAAAGGGAFYTLLSDNDALTSWPTYSPYQVTPNFVPGAVPTYFEQMPFDPLPGASSIPGCAALNYNRAWAYASNGDHYKLVYHCASETGDYDPESRFYDPARPTWAWAVSDNIDYTTWTLGW